MTPIEELKSLLTPIEELKSLLPVLEEKVNQGLIKSDSARKAKSLIAWVELRQLALTDKQTLLIARLLNRAKRRHRDVKITGVAGRDADVDTVVAKVIEKLGSQAIDEKKVIEALMPRVMKAVEDRSPRRVEIVVRQEAEDKKPGKSRGPTHCKFEHLVRAATTRVGGLTPGIFLAGEASSGKTTGARQLAEVLKLDWHFNGAISFPHEMLGFIDGAGKYHRTPFREAYEHGGVYTFDEVDRSDPVALLGVNPHLAGDVATFPDKQIRRHKNCVIVATANTWGLGADANYSGATKLDAAFLSRFPVRISWDIDPVLEDAIVASPEWLARVRRAREMARRSGLKVLIDTRVAQAGAALIASGYSLDEAAAMTYLANLKPDQRTQLS